MQNFIKSSSHAFEEQLRPVVAFDSELTADIDGIFRPLEAAAVSYADGIMFYQKIKPHKNMNKGMPSKGLSLEICSKIGNSIEKVNNDLAYLLRGKTLVCWNLEYELIHFPGLNAATKKYVL